MYPQKDLSIENRERKKSSRIQNSIYQTFVSEEYKKEKYVHNAQKFFNNY